MKVGFDKLTHLGNTQIHEVCLRFWCNFNQTM